MTTSVEPYPNEAARPNSRQQLLSEVESGRRNISLALAAIALISLPMIFFGTHDRIVTLFAATLIVSCGSYILVRYEQASKREMKKLIDRGE